MAVSRFQRSVATTILGLVCNAILATTKLVAGVLGQSMALVADAIESFADLASSLIVWHGVVIADKPADATHPYGHGKAETLAAGAVAVLLIGAAAMIAREAVAGILSPDTVAPAVYTLFVLLGVVLVKETLYRFVGRMATLADNQALAADAWHHRSDAITSAAAAIGISVALIGGERFVVADEWAALFAAGIIALNGFRLLRPVVHELMDAAPDTDVASRAQAIAIGVAGVEHVEKCLARKMGHEYVLDMHVEVDAGMTVSAAHQVSHRVKDAIQEELPRVSEVTIHIEPHQRNAPFSRVAEDKPAADD